MIEMDVIYYMISIMAVFGLSVVCAMLKRGGFSMLTFLASMVIGLTALIWLNIFTSYFIILPILILSGMLFMDNSNKSGVSSE